MVRRQQGWLLETDSYTPQHEDSHATFESEADVKACSFQVR